MSDPDAIPITRAAADTIALTMGIGYKSDMRPICTLNPSYKPGHAC